MTVKDIISLAANFSEREDVASYLEGTVYDEDLEREVERLIDCFKIIEQDVAMRLGHIFQRERFVKEDGVISYGELKKKVVAIKRVENAYGIGLPFLKFPDRIETKEGEVFILYTAMPTEKELYDEAELPLGIGRATVAYGIACEYALMNGLYEEAGLFDKMYKDGLLSLTLHSPKERIGVRKWV